MVAKNKLVDDLMSLGNAVLGNALGARHEFKAQAKQKFDFLAQQLDLVSRAEFDAAFAMLAKARLMQEQLAERLDLIETHLDMPRYAATQLRKAGVKPNEHPSGREGSSVTKAKNASSQSVKGTKVNLPSVKSLTRKAKRK